MNETCSDTKFHVYTTDSELREFKEKKKTKNNMDKMGKLIKFMFSSTMKRKWYFSELFHTHLF